MYTPGPYYQSRPRADGTQSAYVFGRGEDYVGLMKDAETAARVTACLNGCAGIANPAAAGELLEACLAVLAGLECDRIMPRSAAMLRAAIAKATGTETIEHTRTP